MRAVLKGIHAVVEDVNEARKVYSLGFYGRPLTTGKPKGPEDINEPLILSLIEAVYLAEQGFLEVFAEDGRKLSVEELKTCGSNAIDRFDVLYGVYSDLRRKGFVVRSGMKYGADFAVYSVGPGLEHAPLLGDSPEVRPGAETSRAPELRQGVAQHEKGADLSDSGARKGY